MKCSPVLLSSYWQSSVWIFILDNQWYTCIYKSYTSELHYSDLRLKICKQQRFWCDCICYMLRPFCPFPLKIVILTEISVSLACTWSTLVPGAVVSSIELMYAACRNWGVFKFLLTVMYTTSVSNRRGLPLSLARTRSWNKYKMIQSQLFTQDWQIHRRD